MKESFNWESIPENLNPLSFVKVGSVRDGLLKVSSGEITAFIAALPIASHNIRQLGLTNLKVAGHMEGLEELRIGVAKDLPELHLIMNKLIHSLTREEVDAIYRKWISICFEHHLDYAILWKILTGVAVVITGVLYWNRKLSSLNKRIADANTRLVAKSEELKRLSTTDSLTGLYNRMKLDDLLSHERRRLLRYKQSLSLIIVDVDHFKLVNDTHGHQVGDAVLREISHILRSNTRETDRCGRWGGEEFMIICSETDSNGAGILAEQLRRKIKAAIFPEVGSKTASFGITEYREGDTEEDMVQRADKALYNAKEKGRDRVEVIL